jgi:1-acyl-sn-glycerol-3-phosphate acyltransferase
MIEADHKKWARLMFNPYISHLLRSNFRNFYLLNEMPEIPKSAGLIVTPNHFSWWDGFIIDFISRRLIKRKFHIMMLEEQLRKYWFFKKLGAYSINPANPISTARTLNYTRELLLSPQNLVVVYPQGAIQSPNSKIIIIKEGLQKLLDKNKCDVRVLPLAVKFEYGENKNPDIVARFGRLLRAEEIKINFESFSNEFLNNMENLKTTTEYEHCGNIFK